MSPLPRCVGHRNRICPWDLHLQSLRQISVSLFHLQLLQFLTGLSSKFLTRCTLSGFSFSDPPLTSFDSFMRSNSVAYVDESYNPVASTSKDTPRSPDDLVELTFLVQSSDESSNESEHGEFDIDLAKKENRSVRYEVSRLFKKQQECDARCKDLRREIEKKKVSLFCLLVDLLDV